MTRWKGTCAIGTGLDVSCSFAIVMRTCWHEPDEVERCMEQSLVAPASPAEATLGQPKASQAPEMRGDHSEPWNGSDSGTM